MPAPLLRSVFSHTGPGAARLMRKAKIIYFRVFLDFVLLFFTALASTFPFFTVLYYRFPQHLHLLFRFSWFCITGIVIYFFKKCDFVLFSPDFQSSTFAIFPVLYYSSRKSTHLLSHFSRFRTIPSFLKSTCPGFCCFSRFPLTVFLCIFKGFSVYCFFP